MKKIIILKNKITKEARYYFLLELNLCSSLWSVNFVQAISLSGSSGGGASYTNSQVDFS